MLSIIKYKKIEVKTFKDKYIKCKFENFTLIQAFSFITENKKHWVGVQQGQPEHMEKPFW